MHLSVGAYRDQKRASESLELELQAIMSHPAWGLETELGSFAKVVSLHSQFKYLQICRLMKQGNSRNFTFSNAQKQNYLKDVVLWLFCSLFRHKL